MIDENSREAALDLNHSYLVQAPAGSGKTTLLINRYLKTLAYAVKQPEECLAITFTRKAAEEIKVRIINILNSCNVGDSSNTNEKTYMLGCKLLQQSEKLGWNILENPNRLNISTIDALAMKIAKKGEVSGGFEITDTPEILYKNAVIATFEQSQDFIRQAIKNCLQATDNNVEQLIKLLKNLLANREQWLETLLSHKANDGGFAMELLNQNLQQYRELIAADFYNQIPAEFLNNTALWEYLVNNGYDSNLLEIKHNKFEALQALARLFITTTGQLRKSFTKQQGFAASSTVKTEAAKLELQHFKTLIKNLTYTLSKNQELVDSLQNFILMPDSKYSQKHTMLLNEVLKLMPYIVANLKLIFSRTNLIDYSEVNLLAIETLGTVDNPSDIAFEYDTRLQHILIDEFQDTSIVHYNLLLMLISDWSPQLGKTLFLVGDMQQSIYSFRKAEVGLFLHVKKYGINNIKPKYIELKTNFRTDYRLVEKLNSLMQCVLAPKECINTGATKYVVPDAIVEKNSESLVWIQGEFDATNEAEIVCKIIKDLSCKSSEEDIAILLHTRANAKKLIPILNRYNCNYEAIDIFGLKDIQSIHDILTLLKVLIDINNRETWLYLLRTPLFGLSMQDFLVVSESDDLYNEILAFEQAKISNFAKEKLAIILPIIKHYNLKIKINHPIETLYECWQKLIGFGIAKNDLELHALNEFWRICFDRYDSYLALDIDLVASVSNIIDTQMLNQAKPNAKVKIMTIHKAKGLEFDNVILLGLGQKKRYDDKPFFIWQNIISEKKNYLLAAALENNRLRYNDKIYDYLWFLHKAKKLNEDDRVKYVAFTRAKKRIYSLLKINNPKFPNSFVKEHQQYFDTLSCELVESFAEYDFAGDLQQAKYLHCKITSIAEKPNGHQPSIKVIDNISVNINCEPKQAAQKVSFTRIKKYWICLLEKSIFQYAINLINNFNAVDKVVFDVDKVLSDIPSFVRDEATTIITRAENKLSEFFESKLESVKEFITDICVEQLETAVGYTFLVKVSYKEKSPGYYMFVVAAFLDDENISRFKTYQKELMSKINNSNRLDMINFLLQ